VQLQVISENDLHVVQVSDRIDAITSPELEKELMSLIEEGATKLLLDLGEVSYISSAGLRVILMAAQKLYGKGTVAIARPKPEVQEVLEMTGFDAIMPIYSSLENAKDELGI